MLHESNKFVVEVNKFFLNDISFVIISLCVFVVARDLWGQCRCVRGKNREKVLATASSVLSVVFTFIRPAGD